jgi:predicted Rossmann fold flavoprotein
MYTSHDNFLCTNPHFVKSALAQYTQWDFIGLVAEYGIPYHEKNPDKELGQLFCDNSAKDIVNMMLSECDKGQVDIRLRTEVLSLQKTLQGFDVSTSEGDFSCASLVIATGGLSMPKLGATAFGYKVAEQFGLSVFPVRAGLVPVTLHDDDKQQLAELSGVALTDVLASNDESKQDHMSFKEDMLITHRGLSGPSVLQISNYWLPGESIVFDLSPQRNVSDFIEQAKQQQPEQQLNTCLSQLLPKRLLPLLLGNDSNNKPFVERSLKSLNSRELAHIDSLIHGWKIKPNGTEGYRTAEVTIGGVDTDQFSSKTMECKSVAGLYMIGEVLDVTGWLGGYNFQWAWSSGYVAGMNC